MFIMLENLKIQFFALARIIINERRNFNDRSRSILKIPMFFLYKIKQFFTKILYNKCQYQNIIKIVTNLIIIDRRNWKEISLKYRYFLYKK